MSCVANASQIVARLHAGGKPNEQQARGLRPPEVGDDEFALESVRISDPGSWLVHMDWQRASGRFGMDEGEEIGDLSVSARRPALRSIS